MDENIKTYCKKPNSVDKEDEDFKESNKMHGINGYVFANMPGLKMQRDEKIDWYLIGLGNEVDMHTVHFHGQTFLHVSMFVNTTTGITTISNTTYTTSNN